MGLAYHQCATIVWGEIGCLGDYIIFNKPLVYQISQGYGFL